MTNENQDKEVKEEVKVSGMIEVEVAEEDEGSTGGGPPEGVCTSCEG